MSGGGLGSPSGASHGGAFSPFRPPLPSSAYAAVSRLARDDLKPTISPALLSVVEMEQQQDAHRHFGLHSHLGLAPSHTLAHPHFDAETAAQTLTSLRLLEHQNHHPSSSFMKTESVGAFGEAEPLGDALFPGHPFSSLMDTSGDAFPRASELDLGLHSGHSGASSRADSADPNNGDPSSRPFPCDECGKRFQNNSALVKHKLIHSEDRRFACELCGKAFKRQDHLSGHLNVHKSVKPFQCIAEGCDKSYCDGRSLRRHLEHGHNIRNPVVQSQKGTMYVRYDGKEHRVKMRTNTPLPNNSNPGSVGGLGRSRNRSGDSSSSLCSRDLSPGSAALDASVAEKLNAGIPVECSHCNRSFKNMPALNGHMRLHSSIHKERANHAAAASATAQTPPALLQHPTHHPLVSGLQAVYDRSSLPLHQATAVSSFDQHLAQVSLAMGFGAFSGLGGLGGGESLYTSSSTLPLRLGDSVATPLRIETYADDSASLHSLPPPQEQLHSAPAHTMLGAGSVDMKPSPGSRVTAVEVMNNSVPEDLRDVSDVLNYHQSNFARQPDDAYIQEELAVLSSDFDPDVFGEPGADDDHFFDSVLGPPIRKRHPTAPSALGLGGSEPGPMPLEGQLLLSDTFANCLPPQPPSSSNHVAPHSDFQLPAKPKPHASTSLTWKDQMGGSLGETNIGRPSLLADRPRRMSKGKPENLCQILKKGASSQRSSNRGRSSLMSLARSFSTAERSLREPSVRKMPRPSLPNILPYVRGQRQKWRSGGPALRNTGSLLATTGRGRTKPAPLVLPGAGWGGGARAYPSQLRSPRCWDPPPSSHSSSKTPPPYTPPPILSPLRNGSGLFWRVQKPLGALGSQMSVGPGATFSELSHYAMSRGCPKSAPIANSKQFWSKHQKTRNSIESIGLVASDLAVSNNNLDSLDTIVDEVEKQEEGAIVASTADIKPSHDDLVITVPPIDDEDDDAEKPPETDTTPHINVGPSFQAQLEEACLARDAAEVHPASLLFSPDSLSAVPDGQVDALLRFASSAALPAAGRNTELALHVLHRLGGDVQQTMLTLMDEAAVRALDADENANAAYTYADSDFWSNKEVAAFTDALTRLDGKDFFLAARELGTKTTAQCVAFYYTWKKACPDDYRRLRNLIHKKRDQQRQQAVSVEYNLRSGSKSSLVEPNNNNDEDERMDDGDEISDEDDAAEGVGLLAISGVEASILDDLARINAATPSSTTADEDFDERYPSPRPGRPGRKGAGARKVTPGGIPDANGLFPCRKCSKTFAKVKSRNAHMKSHSMAARASLPSSNAPTPDPSALL